MEKATSVAMKFRILVCGNGSHSIELRIKRKLSSTVLLKMMFVTDEKQVSRNGVSGTRNILYIIFFTHFWE